MKLQKISELFSNFFRTCFASISELFLGRSGCKDKGFPSKLPNIFRTFFAAFPALFRHRTMNQRLSCENFLISSLPTNRPRNHAIFIIYRYSFFRALLHVANAPAPHRRPAVPDRSGLNHGKSVTAATECDSTLNFTHAGIFSSATAPIRYREPRATPPIRYWRPPATEAYRAPTPTAWPGTRTCGRSGDGSERQKQRKRRERQERWERRERPIRGRKQRKQPTRGRGAQTIFSTVMSGSARRSSIKASSPFAPLARMTSVARCTTPSGVRAASTS